jgi:predicted transcriptional regulator
LLFRTIGVNIFTVRQGGGYLSKREQQIMEIVYAHERTTASELEQALPGNPSNSTVRTLLRILEQQGHLTHVEEDGRFVYLPVKPKQSAARQALDKVVQTFYRGSIGEVVAALLDEDQSRLTPEQIDRLQAMIDRAKGSDK